MNRWVELEKFAKYVRNADMGCESTLSSCHCGPCSQFRIEFGVSRFVCSLFLAWQLTGDMKKSPHLHTEAIFRHKEPYVMKWLKCQIN